MAGWRVLYYPKTYILHKVGMTSKRLDQFEVNFHSVKNRLRSHLKNLSAYGLVTIFFPHMVFNFILSGYYLVSFQFLKAGMIGKAVLWNIIHFSETVKFRHQVQKTRKISDHNLFKKVTLPVSWVDMFIHFRRVEANFK